MPDSARPWLTGQCNMWSRTTTVDDVATLLRRIAGDIDEARGHADVLDIVVSLDTLSDEATATVYVDVPSSGGGGTDSDADEGR